MFGVVDGIGNQIAQDPFYPTRIDLRDHLLGGQIHQQLDTGLLGQVAHIAERVVDRCAQVDRLNRQLGHPGVMPRDLQQVVEQRLESVQLANHQLGGPPQRGVEVGAVVIDQVGRHPHRGQRRTQFVADVGGEPAL